MMQPDIGYRASTVATWSWAADNGCFNAKWSPLKWAAWLDRMATTRGCLFAAIPDVVGDHGATLQLWQRWRPVVPSSYPVAFVCQNGCTVGDVPWGETDAVFLGGDTDYKLSATANAIVRESSRRGLWAHMGRVNSLRRLRIAADFGCDSADGTFLAFGPDTNTPRLCSWLDSLSLTPSLFAPQ